MTDKDHIENVISNTFAAIQTVYNNQINNTLKSSTRSRIIFPHKRNGELRVSEQELRFVFVEQLNKEIQKYKWNVYYSVETPTINKYTFTGVKEPSKSIENGRSGNIDLVIHDPSLNRIALIEFKANNPEEKKYAKDLVKLDVDGKEAKYQYFIQIVKKADEATIKNIKDKIRKYQFLLRCWSLEGKNITKAITEKDITKS